VITLSRADYPFKHATGTQVLDPLVADKLRAAVETFDGWEHSAAGFYRNSLCHFTDRTVPHELASVLVPELTEQVHDAMQRAFKIKLAAGAQMMLNRFVPGDGTLVHNDYLEDAEHRYFFTHRALLYLNEDWNPPMGGILGIFDAPDATRPVATIQPHHNTMSAMAMGPSSYHAVSAQHGPVRYSIVWSFHTTDRRHQL
jgi:hypothetical protein